LIKKEKTRVLTADKINLDDTGILSTKNFDIQIKYNLDNDFLLEYLKNEEIKDKRIRVLIIKSQRKIDKIFLSRCNLEVIATASKGIDHIDYEYAKKMNIKIINSENGNYMAAAEHTLGLIICLSKKIIYSNELVKNNKFAYWDFKRNNLAGKKIGIIGFGKVGSYVGRLAKAFQMEVMANDINYEVVKKNKDFKFYGLEEIFRKCDILTIHIPLNKNNFKFINAKNLALLNKNVIFVNTSRGEVIDEDFLLDLLTKNSSIYAGLDVFCNEPDLNEKFFKLSNVLLTNHIAGKTEESSENIAKEILKKVKNEYKKTVQS